MSYSDISQDRFLGIYVGFGLAVVLQVTKYGEFNRMPGKGLGKVFF